jgi:trimethyllysine dioxygenase
MKPQPSPNDKLTFLGGFYDFTSDLTMKDTAYTSLALPAHTDTTYFTDPAGLQMFHLLSHENGEGGASLLVDGFKAARILRKESPRSYQVLAQMPISSHASGNEGITITPATKFPVLNFQDLKDKEYAKLMQVRWNNDDRGVIALKEDFGMGAERWYKAARKWNEILKRKNTEYWAQLKPGRPLSMFIRLPLIMSLALTRRQSLTIGGFCMVDQLSRERGECAVATVGFPAYMQY